MAINLAKYKDRMQEAWSEVLDDKSNINWALYGYEGQSNDLNLISKGSGGLEEMAEDLNSGSVMYAFCQVHDPKTSLPKYVLIIWQGEGAPIVRKGMCANHLPAVESFFKGAHIKISARAEEDVDPAVVTEKVSKSTGSAYSFKQRAEVPHQKANEPVGTAYKRVNPIQEINYKERDKFWEKEEQEEKRRQEEERLRREEEKKRQEKLLRERDAAEAAERERRAAAQEQKTNEIRSSVPVKPAVVDTVNELAEREREEQERRGRSEALRRERSQEAQTLIAKRTVNARAVFEQNTSAGQLNLPRGRRASYQPTSGQINGGSGENGVEQQEVIPPQSLGRKASLPTWPPPSQGEKIHTLASHPETVSSPQAEKAAEKSSVPTTVPAAAQEEETPPSEEEQDWESEPSSTGTIVRKSHKSNPESKSASDENESKGVLKSEEPASPESNGAYANAEDDDEDLGLRARALYDYQAADDTEITFDPGDVITHIDQIDQGWWQGLGPDGNFGLFPANYVQLIDLVS